MSTPDRKPEIHDELFDRLVDGELSEAERHELLKRLDESPQNWRRCALAFLEAQSWRESVGEMFAQLVGEQEPGRDHGVAPLEAGRSAVELDSATVAPTPRTHSGPRPANTPGGERGSSRSRLAGRNLLALAAGFTVAFVTGIWGHVWWTARQSVPAEPSMVTTTEVPSPRTSIDAPEAPGAAERPWDWVTVPVQSDESGVVNSVPVPVLKEETDETGWARVPTTLPPEVVSSLLRQGHEVRQNRRMMPVTLPDGRRSVVPVDEYEIRFVGERKYQ